MFEDMTFAYLVPARIGRVLLAAGLALSAATAYAESGDTGAILAPEVRYHEIQQIAPGEIVPPGVRAARLSQLASEGIIAPPGARAARSSPSAIENKIAPAGARNLEKTTSRGRIAPASTRKIQASSTPESEYSPAALRDWKGQNRSD